MKNLDDYTEQELKEALQRKKQKIKVINIPPEYKNPVGVWEVTTEGDTEGRSTKNLGTWKGHIVDIAAKLAEKSFYALHFAAVSEKELVAPQSYPESVHIALDVDSKTWNLDPKLRSEVLKEMLSKTDPPLLKEAEKHFKVEQGQYFASVKITFNNK